MVEEKLILKEQDLQLVVNKKTLGSLTTNAKQIKELVEKALPNYDISNYNEDNIDLAKKDKAMLNSASKALNTKRIEIEKEFLKPFGEFKEIVSETIKLISSCSDTIDVIVQQSVDKFKNEKKSLIIEHFNSHKFELVSLEKIFDDKWLNKTTKIKDVYVEVDTKIASIKDDMVTLEAIGDNVELLISLYLDTLNINTTIQYAKTLKENADKAKLEADKDIKVAVQYNQIVSETNPFEKSNTVIGVEETKNDEQLLVRKLKVKATKDKIIDLADFMNVNGIQFEKIE
jgi:hypothetical protein